MKEALLEKLRCPRCREPLCVWNATEEDGGEIVEGTLACHACGGTFPVHSTIPILLVPGRRAVDEFAATLGREAQKVGFSKAVRSLADGTVEYPATRTFEPAVTAAEVREGRYRASESFWETFSRNRLVQQQQNALTAHLDAMEEMWLRAEVNFADTVLDVGTGWGGALVPLVERAPQDAMIFGFDTAFLNLRVAQGQIERAQHENVVFVVGDCLNPPFRERLFDAVVSWFGIGRIPGFVNCLRGILGVLGPGRAFSCAWTPLVNDLDGLASRADLIGMAEQLDIPTRPDETAGFVEAIGFEEVELSTVGPIFVLSGRAPIPQGSLIPPSGS